MKRIDRPPSFDSTERKAATRVLEKTRTLLSKEVDDGKIRMICPAIDKAVRKVDTQLASDVAPKLQELIRFRLEGCSSLRHWLAKKGFKDVYSDDPAVYRKVQDTRHQWVADLIKELNHEQTGSGADVPHKKRALRAPRREARSASGSISDYINYGDPGW